MNGPYTLAEVAAWFAAPVGIILFVAGVWYGKRRAEQEARDEAFIGAMRRVRKGTDGD